MICLLIEKCSVGATGLERFTALVQGAEIYIDFQNLEPALTVLGSLESASSLAFVTGQLEVEFAAVMLRSLFFLNAGLLCSLSGVAFIFSTAFVAVGADPSV